jgi:hypothetical protein
VTFRVVVPVGACCDAGLWVFVAMRASSRSLSRMTERKARARARSIDRLVVVVGQVCKVFGAGEDFV